MGGQILKRPFECHYRGHFTFKLNLLTCHIPKRGRPRFSVIVSQKGPRVSKESEEYSLPNWYLIASFQVDQALKKGEVFTGQVCEANGKNVLLLKFNFALLL